MEEAMRKIFDGFDMETVKQVFQEIDKNLANLESLSIITFTAFVNKMFDEGHYGHRDIVFLEKMVEQIEGFGDYFFHTAKDKEVLFIDIGTLDAYNDWLQKLVWHLDGLQITLKGNNLVRAISDIQMGISYFMAGIFLDIGSINKFSQAGLFGDAISSYLIVIEQISIFQNGTLKYLKEVLEYAKD